MMSPCAHLPFEFNQFLNQFVFKIMRIHMSLLRAFENDIIKNVHIVFGNAKWSQKIDMIWNFGFFDWWWLSFKLISKYFIVTIICLPNASVKWFERHACIWMRFWPRIKRTSIFEYIWLIVNQSFNIDAEVYQIYEICSE